MCGSPDELGRLREKVRMQASSIRQMQLVLERKNRELDALHLVWCDGGCPGGVHRWVDEKTTRELVEAAERNTRRLRNWYDVVKWKLEHYTAGQETDLGCQVFRASEWHEQYVRRAAAKTDLLDGSP